MAPPKAASTRADQPVFGSADDAAFAALDEILDRSINENVEFAGRIFRVPSKELFAFTRPRRGSRDDSDPGPRTPPPKLVNAVNVGTYHTHGGNFQETDEIFSPQDRLKAVMAKELMWLGTPYKRILRFVPLNLLPDPSSADPELKGEVEVLRSAYTLREVTIEGTPSRD